MKTLPLIAVLAGSSLNAQNVRGGYLWSDQGSNVTIIAGDGVPDPVQVLPLRVKGSEFTFVITNSDGSVLAYANDNVFDLEGAGPGTCRIYGFTYEGEFTFPTGVDVKTLSSSGKSALTKNRINISRKGADSVDGGYVLNDRNGYGRVRINLERDARPFRVYSFNEAAGTTDYAFIITDNDGNVLGYPEGNVIDLSAAPPGICRVYGISFTGELNKETGINVSDVTSSNDNQSLSGNWVSAVRR